VKTIFVNLLENETNIINVEQEKTLMCLIKIWKNRFEVARMGRGMNF